VSARVIPGAVRTLLILLLVLFCAFPLYWMIVTAIKVPREVLTYPPTFWPSEFTLQSFRTLFTQTRFLTYFMNSVIVSGVSTVTVVVVGAFGAYSLTRFKYPGRELLANFTLLAYMFPPIVLMVPIFLLAKSMGLADSLFGLILAYTSFAMPFALWMLRSFFQDIPIELEHAAWIDGATRMQAFVRVVLPLAMPGTIATSIFTFIVSWNDFLFARVLITKDTLKPLTVGVNDFFNMAVIDWGMIMAAGVMISLPALIFFTVSQKYLVEGWGAGGVKG
jgi:multiple sugar transport system permease protein